MAHKTLDEYIDGWAPGAITDVDPLRPEAAALLRDILDAGDDSSSDGTLPPLWHWAYFTTWPAQRALGEDGHPTEGHFLPPLPNRRRMWAGGHVTLHGRLRLNTETTRTGTLTDVQVKHGRSGDMILASVRYDYVQAGTTLISELQNHVYRIGDDDAARPAWGPRPVDYPDSDLPWQFRLTTDQIRLFRLSAVTGNSHRIHYDRPYAEDVEHYPGLVVHGPLLALQMAGLARRHDPALELAEIDYRVLSPVFVGEPVLVTGRPSADTSGAELQVLSQPDTVHAKGTATYRRTMTNH
ncbi:3-methylfumaryl-CoA hydratase [Antricoccus suffuscus]|uniref:3-methylfumaryl-CoA hydratase n=1 Tax=Antricoccus suffuscus TaxID=1629062 RepID=A0A2T0ZXL5_9ACTN|nr:hypothetical protein [Antricoccus suffuscus]PRZ40818.1 3-methylfumaryl-CoA hydratase [Antricoccus suffuscus]